MSRFTARTLVLLLFFIAVSAVWAEVAVPPLKARVTDLTGMLTAEQQATLEARLKAFEGAKGSQIAVLIVPTTHPESVEQYALRVAETWKLGRKGVDDGALLLIARDDHTMRIEVGYGLEGVLNDATAKRITSEIIVPAFKQGRFYDGISAGIDRMIRVVEGEPLPAPAVSKTTPVNLNFIFEHPFIFLTFVFFVLVIFVGILAMFAKDGRNTRWSSSSSSNGFFSSGGGSSGSSSGFSGGGGSFGGGGASGSW